MEKYHCMSINYRIFLSLLIAILPGMTLSAQTSTGQRNILIQRFEKDSIHATYNEDYFLMEDSCAHILRIGFYDMALGKFTGPFKDVSKANPKQLLATGRYNENGQKEGAFISYYRNGNLEARGYFKEDRFEGKWEFFYPTGKPKHFYGQWFGYQDPSHLE